METCTRACIAKDLRGNRVQVNAGDRVKLYRKYKGIWKVILFGKGVVTITNDQLIVNFGTPVESNLTMVSEDDTPPIGMVEVFI